MIANHTETSGIVHRTFCSAAIKDAVQLTDKWMQAAGLATRIDAACNLIGRSSSDDRPMLLIGSHIDTVPNGGKYDGALGVLFGIAAAQMFQDRYEEFPFKIGVVAFSEEEGVRYRSPYIGSRALAGCFDENLLDRLDDQGISCRQAIQDFGGNPDAIADCALQEPVLCFLEPHIEQGPVLEKMDLAVGIVDGIAGQTRATARFVGRASHAGTVPMHLRLDAMAGAAEWIVGVEAYAKQTAGLVATVGYVHVTPNVPNVIAGDVGVRLDCRHLTDVTRQRATQDLHHLGEQIAARRNLQFSWERCEEQSAVAMDPIITRMLDTAAKDAGVTSYHMASGAGHDAVIMSEIVPTSMIFIRCKDGISHHPDESIEVKDVEVALQVMYHFIERLAKIST